MRAAASNRGSLGAIVNLPNSLTVVRIVLAPILVLALEGGSGAVALTVFGAAMATDVLDGHLARSRDSITTFGKLMDPVADKLLIGGAFVCLAVIDRIDPWIVTAIVAREVAVSGLRVIACRHRVVISANRLGKAKTAIQAVAIVALIVAPNPAAAWVDAIVAATVAITIVSGLAYGISYRTRSRPTALRAVEAQISAPASPLS
ncbi:MAG: CDP-diacylglycerol--glycerol-3-phosphate 3-phosphatidyltransferase [Solirubrobacterales bacterium]|nr:CDP-diacylglycerol--glycerol-3-phosphate 3-phosphatidyltransferase [Solirubrobacterales bacterium]